MKRYDEIITGAEPVTAAELAKVLEITDPGQTPFLTTLVKVARQQVEAYCRIAIVQRTITMFMDRFPVEDHDKGWWDGVREAPISSIFAAVRKIEMPLPPLQSVTSVTTFDDSDVGTIFAAAGYFVDTASKRQQGRVVLRDGITWPIALRSANAIQFVYVAGYADGSVPDDLKQAILGIGAYLFANRGDCGGDCVGKCGMAMLLESYIIRVPR